MPWRLLLNLKVKGLSFWRTAFYMPAVVPAMAVAYVFSWMLQSDVGLLNQSLRAIGLPGPKWFGDPNWVLAAFILMSAWAVGGTLLLYLSALQGVPTELYDASKVDGANAWRRFLNVTLPMTSPVIFFVFLTGMIGTFQVFTVAFVTTNGGPGEASLFYLLYLYRTGWEYLQMGYAAAMAWLLFVILLVDHTAFAAFIAYNGLLRGRAGITHVGFRKCASWRSAGSTAAGDGRGVDAPPADGATSARQDLLVPGAGRPDSCPRRASGLDGERLV